jgi:hypothetical protein
MNLICNDDDNRDQKKKKCPIGDNPKLIGVEAIAFPKLGMQKEVARSPGSRQRT